MARVLVVDDHSISRHFLVQLLSYFGHELAEAVDGREGLEIAPEFRPDAIFSDIIMPRLDGLEMTRELRRRPETSSTPIIMYTATYRLPEARTLAAAAGATDVLPKPSEPPTIIATLNKLLGITDETKAGASVPAPKTVARRPRVKRIAELEESRRSLGRTIDDATAVQDRGAELEARLREAEAQLESLLASNLRRIQVEELGLSLARERSPLSLAALVAGASRAIMNASGAAFGLIGADGATVQHLHCEGLSPADRRTLETEASGLPLLRRVLVEGEPVLMQGGGARVRSELHLEDVNGPVLIVPVHYWSEAHGWLMVTREENAPPFNDEDLENLTVIALQAGLASQNIERYDDLQRHDADLLMEVMERRRTEQALSASEARLRWILEHVDDGILALGLDGGVTYASPSVSRILGYTPEQLENINAFDLVHPEELAEAHARFTAILDGRDTFRSQEFRLRGADGTWRLIEATPTRASSDWTGEGVVAVIRDVTQRRESLELRILAEAEIEASRLKSALLNTVSHELRTPLTTVKAMSSTITTYWDRLGPEEIKNMALLIDKSLDHLATLVSDLFTYSLLSSSALKMRTEEAELGSFIEVQAEFFRRAHPDCELRVALPARKIWVHADVARLRQVCDNLLTNAAKYGDPGLPIELSLRAEGDNVSIAVKDHGRGVEPGELQQIFEPFYRAPGAARVSDGGGMGLPICRGLAEQMGGSLTAHLPPEGGFEVICTLPRVRARRRRMAA